MERGDVTVNPLLETRVADPVENDPDPTLEKKTVIFSSKLVYYNFGIKDYRVFDMSVQTNFRKTLSRIRTRAFSIPVPRKTSGSTTASKSIILPKYPHWSLNAQFHTERGIHIGRLYTRICFLYLVIVNLISLEVLTT